MASSMAPLPRITGTAQGDKVEALAVKWFEATWFTDGHTRILVRSLDISTKLSWVDIADFRADHQSVEK